MERVICLAIGYCFGLFQTGYLYGKLHGRDIRKYGSGNSGSTNVLRVMGKKAGAIVLVGDVMKCILACFAAWLIFHNRAEADFVRLLEQYAAAGAVLGHNFPFYMHFKGGKGVACSGGLIIAMRDWRLFLICLAVFLGTVLLTRFVSLGSILGLTAFFVVWTALCATGAVSLGVYTVESCVVVFLMAALGIWQHRTNIGRLLHGTENKLWGKK
ncbi:MAG: glycerol-3-phosphate 1-O-acyltransferase PlsY [Lachnospiraceae bacterium]|nr:glycerol-3-phosphate 1-O-acyltransferase PlsY [Lachnospiraceae bacterium]